MGVGVRIPPRVPYASKRGQAVKNNETPFEVFVTVLLGVLIVFGLVLALVPLYGCVRPPQSHAEWAKYCMSKSNSEFINCLNEWDEWEKK